MPAKYFLIIRNYVLSVSLQRKYTFYHQNTFLDAFRTNSRNIIGRNPSMVIPLLANQDLTPMLSSPPWEGCNALASSSSSPSSSFSASSTQSPSLLSLQPYGYESLALQEDHIKNNLLLQTYLFLRLTEKHQAIGGSCFHYDCLLQ